MQHLRPVDRLVVDVALDNMSDNYSSKPHHVSPEFNNVMAAGATEISGSTLCCAQLGLVLALTVYVGQCSYKLLFDKGPEGTLFLRNCQTLAYHWRMWRPSPFRRIGISAPARDSCYLGIKPSYL